MDGDKIKVTYDDLNDSRVDEKIAREASIRNSKRISTRPRKKLSLNDLYKSWRQLMVVGVVGALVIWGITIFINNVFPLEKDIEIGNTNYVLTKKAQKYLKLVGSSHYEKSKSVIIIEEPHYNIDGQFNLFKGLETFFDENPGLVAKTIFLTEGIPSNQPVSAQPLINAEPNPSEELIREVLGTFLITGYIAYEWKYQRNIPIVGIEDKTLYDVSARLWTEVQNNENDIEKVNKWVFTVAARNKRMAKTLIEKTYIYENPILFVGGRHLEKQNEEDFQKIKSDGFGYYLNPKVNANFENSENLGVRDYLEKERIGYTFLVALSKVYDASKVSEENIETYAELFKAQQKGDYNEYIKSLLSRKHSNKGVTVAPSPQAAAQFVAAVSASGKASANKKANKKKGKKKGKKGKGKKGKKGKRHTPEQQEVVEDAKNAEKKGGVTPEEAGKLVDKAGKAGLPARGPESHPNRPHGKDPHIHIGPVEHIPVK